jgi:hypothetical protein
MQCPICNVKNLPGETSQTFLLCCRCRLAFGLGLSLSGLPISVCWLAFSSMAFCGWDRVRLALLCPRWLSVELLVFPCLISLAPSPEIRIIVELTWSRVTELASTVALTLAAKLSWKILRRYLVQKLLLVTGS